MSEELENKKENIENRNEVQTKMIENKIPEKKPKKMKTRTMLVLLFIVLFLLGSAIMYRADYLETLEIGEEYLAVFNENVKYKLYIGIINSLFVFTIVYITNKLIKKGLKKFFEEEKKKMPKLPNKSLALVFAAVTSIVVSKMFLQKVILFVNSAWFGMSDPIFGMDVGFYMFQAPLIGQLLYYGATLSILLLIYTVAYYIIAFNIHFEGINGQTLRRNTFIKQILFYVMLIAIFVSGIMIFNVQNMEIRKLLNIRRYNENYNNWSRSSRWNKIMGI